MRLAPAAPSTDPRRDDDADRDPRFALLAALYAATATHADGSVAWREVASRAGLDWAEAEVCLRALADEQLVSDSGDGRARISSRGVLAVEWPCFSFASVDDEPSRAPRRQSMVAPKSTPTADDGARRARAAREAFDPAVVVAEIGRRIDEIAHTGA